MACHARPPTPTLGQAAMVCRPIRPPLPVIRTTATADPLRPIRDDRDLERPLDAEGGVAPAQGPSRLGRELSLMR